MSFLRAVHLPFGRNAADLCYYLQLLFRRFFFGFFSNFFLLSPLVFCRLQMPCGAGNC